MKSGQSHRNLWNKINHANMYMIGIPRVKEKEKEREETEEGRESIEKQWQRTSQIC